VDAPVHRVRQNAPMTTFAERVDATTIETLVARASCKWASYPGTIGAWVAEMDFGLAAPIADALARMHADLMYGYPNQSMVTGLRAAASDFMAERYGWQVDPKSIAELSDVLTGMGVVISNYTAPDAPIVVLTPCYMPFMTIPPAFGRRLVQVPMAQDADGWVLDADALAAALTPGALLVLANPFNPLGKVWTRPELERLSQIVDAAGAKVFSDDIHAPLTYEGFTHVPYASVNDVAAAHTITAVSASKAWNLAGLKCAQLVFTNPADLALWNASARRRAAEASNPGIVAGTAAYRDGGPWLADALAYLDVNRRLVAERVPTEIPGARVSPLQGTYLQWIDFRDAGLPGNPRQFFFERARVALTDGVLCGDAGAGFVRMNLATPTPILNEILDRMANSTRARSTT